MLAQASLPSDQSEILNAMSQLQRQMVGEHYGAANTPRSALRVGTAAAFYEARAAAQHLVVRQVEKEVLFQEVERILEETKSIETYPEAGKLNQVMKEKVKQRLGRLQSPPQVPPPPNGGPAMPSGNSGVTEGQPVTARGIVKPTIANELKGSKLHHAR